MWETDQSQCALLQGRLGLFISPSVIGENHVSDAFSEQQEILSKVAGEEVVFEDGKIAVALLNLAEILIFLSFCR